MRKSYNITTAELALSAATDYYPFGMPMPNRQIVGGEQYRYAFQGQEKDPETGKEAFQLRLWDGRIGRWLTTDPAGQYSSPYLGMGNDPINNIDPNGGIVVLADNTETRALIAKIMKSPYLKAIYEKLHKSTSHFYINVSNINDFKNSIFRKTYPKNGGKTYFDRWNDKQITILIAYSKNTAANIAAIADELKTAEQFENYKLGFARSDGDVEFYDPIDEIETKKASLIAIKHFNFTIDQMDGGENFHSTKVMKALEKGYSDMDAIKILMDTGYKAYFEKGVSIFADRTVPQKRKFITPDYYKNN